MSEETEFIKTSITGLETRRDDLIAIRDIFLQVKGLDEQAEKEHEKVANLKTDIQAGKEELAGKQDEKRDAIRTTMLAITKAMNKIIPEGDGCIEISDEGPVMIGWFKDNKIRPYEGLSGGEKVIFDAALSYALLSGSQNKVVILEAAELDNENLEKMLDHLSGLVDCQLLVNTWAMPKKIPDGWAVEVIE